MEKPMMLVPFTSIVDTEFWHKLCTKKLDEYKLDDSDRSIHGYYLQGTRPGMPARICVGGDGFEPVDSTKASPPPQSVAVAGTMLLFNQLQHFRDCDKSIILNGYGNKIWKYIVSGAALEDPYLLNSLLLLVYADLKKYHYYYWFAFPAIKIGDIIPGGENMPLESYFSPLQLACLQSSYKKASEVDGGVIPFFTIRQSDGSVQPLKRWREETTDGKLLVGMCDPSSQPNHAGWPLRNLLALLSHVCRGYVDTVSVVCYRESTRQGKTDCSNSIVIPGLPLVTVKVDKYGNVGVSGWERNTKGKLGPRFVNLSEAMDPKRLSEAAVDLNLRLMRWRLLPSLNLDNAASVKCLLLGSGTLGCNVARCLLGWGVRHITMVDNATVSFSNPVRQSLFLFEDCLQGGKQKAIAASDMLKRIFPGVHSTGIQLDIPMPGHAVGPESVESTRNAVKTLEDLIAAHDVVFLLMDTRESRWLPTLLCQAMGKLTMNGALGFDSFLVMRHGVQQQPANERLGCYFCSDVIAPVNTTKDRTLDQQCTVSRPGLSLLASSIVTELCMAVIQHAKGPLAPASPLNTETEAEDISPLGLIPHQVRGFLSSYTFFAPFGQANAYCTACSPIVVERYRQEGFDFLHTVFNKPLYLEEMTGLAEMKRRTEEVDCELYDSDGGELDD